MRAILRVEAAFGDPESLDRTIAHDVGCNDFLHVAGANTTVPDRIGIYHDVRPVFALIEATGFVSPNRGPQPSECYPRLECAMQFTLTGRIAAASRMAFRPLIGANENVFLKLRHTYR